MQAFVRLVIGSNIEGKWTPAFVSTSNEVPTPKASERKHLLVLVIGSNIEGKWTPAFVSTSNEVPTSKASECNHLLVLVMRFKHRRRVNASIC